MRTPSRSLLSSAAVLAVAASLASPVTALPRPPPQPPQPPTSPSTSLSTPGTRRPSSPTVAATAPRSTMAGSRWSGPPARPATPTRSVTARGSYDTATWTSPSFALASTSTSWSPPGTPTLQTAPGSRSRCAARRTSARRPKWYVLGRWACDDPADGGASTGPRCRPRATTSATSRSTPSSPRTGRTLSDWQLRVTLTGRTARR